MENEQGLDNNLLIEVKNLKTYFYLDEGSSGRWMASISTSTAARRWAWWARAAAARASPRARCCASCPGPAGSWRARSCCTGVRMSDERDQ